jgi:4-hydroxybenzoate polyprenyltransferase
MAENVEGVAGYRARRASELVAEVLCVDVEGALLRSHPHQEALFAAIKDRPILLLWLLLWPLGGRRRLIAARNEMMQGSLDPSRAPRRAEVEKLMAGAKSAGQRVELVTSIGADFVRRANISSASFDGVLTCPPDSLNAQQRAALLQSRYPLGFSYVGHGAADLPVWRAAAQRYAVDGSPFVRNQTAAEGIELVELSRAESPLSALLRSMRLHQWLKNLLVLVPLGLMIPRATPTDFLNFFCGFVLFGLLASGTYLLNDMFDVQADRSHASKRKRPIASGDLALSVAAVAASAMIVLALIGATWLSRNFALTALAYLFLTLAYSLWLKSIPIIDVLAIATLFTLRVLAGMLLVDQPISEWLLTFSIFFFLSLALIKRHVELGTMVPGDTRALHGRGYAQIDQNFVAMFGVASGVASLIIFAFFISSVTVDPNSHYVSPQLLWAAMALVSYWLMRMWLLTMRGLMDDDPIIYAARERATLIVAGLTVMLAVAAQTLSL